MLKVYNDVVYGLQEALIRARYPMLLEVEDMSTMKARYSMKDLLGLGERLGKTSGGEGHDKFLRFIIVQMDILAPRYWWQEFDTYHHVEKMSQSTMHRFQRLDLKKLLDNTVPAYHIAYLQSLVDDYKNATDELERHRLLHEIKACMPEGLHITAGISTNYAQLKTMYKQRKNHRLEEWRQFCAWVKQLPFTEALGVLGKAE